MPLTITNTTCDIYRFDAAPPASPAATGVSCLLRPAEASNDKTAYFTHVLLLGETVDLRDDFVPATMSIGGNADKIYIPDQSGTRFDVLLVRRQARGTAADHKEVLLRRATGVNMTWPSDNL